MQLRDILQRLKNVKGGNGQYTALCPAHSDQNPSLAISEKDGKILLHCHAGCSKENIVSALGLEMKDLFTEERSSQCNTSNSKPKREIAAVYDYKDLDGNIIHSTIRYNPKSFSQRRPDPDKPGEYIWKEVFKGITPILYNLQAVAQAISNDQRTMAVNLLNHWFLPFDNVSFINEETSDTLCRAITGGGIQQRRLHTNSEDTIFTFQRCVAINGIHNVATRADLLDRSILIELIRITDSDRKELSAVLANFEADKADILGGIFDTVVKAMNIFPSVKLQNLPRMADFARWGYAIGEALGEGLGQTFLNEYTGNRQIQNEEAIANDPVATLIVEFMKDRQEWTGLFSTLYRLLADIAEDNGISVKHKSFPANAIVLSKRITAIKSNLENVGIYCVSEKRNKHGQNLSIKRSNSSTPITPSALTAENKGFSGVERGADRTREDVSAPITTPRSTPEKACKHEVSVDNVGGVDKNGTLAESWFAAVEDIEDSELPPEFLKPTPKPPTQKETHAQLSL